jgi:Icc-related predicted phosphoesterase
MQGIAPRFKLVLYIPGNHDICVEKEPMRCREYFETSNMKMLLHRPYEWKGIKFFGSPYQPDFYQWSFQYPRWDGARVWNAIPEDSDVVITHGMPEGILDASGRELFTRDEAHLGCKALRERLRIIKPKIFAGGHLHHQGGQSVEENGTIWVNAAMCDDQYKPTRKPVVIDYDFEENKCQDMPLVLT